MHTDTSPFTPACRRHTPVLRTASTWAASFLQARGIRLLRVLPSDDRHPKGAYEFDNTDLVASRAMNEWWQGNPLIEAKTLLASRNTLGSLLHRAEVAQAPIEVDVEGVQA